MAVNITVALDDAEQAYIETLAAAVAPEATPAQILAWATDKAREGLVQAIRQVRNEHVRSVGMAARKAADPGDWPVEAVEEPAPEPAPE